MNLSDEMKFAQRHGLVCCGQPQSSDGLQIAPAQLWSLDSCAQEKQIKSHPVCSAH